MSDSASGRGAHSQVGAESGGRHRKPERQEESGGVQVAGSEDVLVGSDLDAQAFREPAVPPRARRSPWNRGRDRIAVALLVLGCLLATGTVWAFSDQRATVQETAQAPPPLPAAPAAVPGSLTEMWRAPSAATPAPVAAGSTVVTGDGGEVLGRNALTGEVRWRYARDLPLCTVAEAWDRVLAVHRKSGAAGTAGCSEVTQLDPDTGARTAQRNSNAEVGTRLVVADGHVTTTGTHLLNTWRDDLVRSAEYGRVPALVNPDKQPRTGCAYGSVAATSGKVGVIERCPQDPADRLTVYKAAPENSDEPEPEFSTVLPGRSAKLVALSDKAAAVVLPEQNRLVLYGPKGREQSSYPLDLPASDLAQDPPGGVVPTAEGAANVYWFTGSRTMALSKDDLTPKWTVNGTRGAGTLLADEFVMPITGGLAVINEDNGEAVRTVAVDRRGHQGPVALSATGPVLLEQRGGTVVALR